VDDRIRAIANGLGLRTIIWKYDSNDWKAGSGNITEASVDSAYNAFIAMAENGTFSTVSYPFALFRVSRCLSLFRGIKDRGLTRFYSPALGWGSHVDA
jgi:hypothetical protein